MNIILKIIDSFKREAEVQPSILLGMEGMAERNEARIAAIKQEMGEKWLMHPTNIKKRLDEPRPV